MTAFLESPHYYSSNIKTEFQPQNPSEFNDFFVDHDSLAPVKSYCKDYGNWEYVVSHLRQQIFNSTSASYPAPETYFIKKAKDELYNTHTAAAMLSMIDHNATFRFNSDPFCAADPMMYRRDRSENLLVRMIHCKNLDMSQISLMRLSRGVFVHQKWQSSSPQSSPTLSAIEDSLSNRYIDATGNFKLLFSSIHSHSHCY